MTPLRYQKTIVFSDLDGCLLNHDYTFTEALPALKRLQQLGIELVLASSKTEAEMVPIAEEIGTPSPLICENGGVIAWRGCMRVSAPHARTIVGTPREEILQHLSMLSDTYRFRSFDTMGVAGIIETTGLSPQQAERAAQRFTNEPLVWEDDHDKLEDFGKRLNELGLSFTRGGRFWHVAGQVNKGSGLKTVLSEFEIQTQESLFSVAIGDSPIDLPMLEIADLAIVIPGFNQQVQIQPQNPNVLVASQAGALGWNTALQAWMDSLSDEQS